MRRPGIVAPAGPPSDVKLMLSWRPGAVTCYYEHLRANDLYAYKAQHPTATIVVRFQHPRQWWRNPEQTAVSFGQRIAATWAEIRPLDPYVCFANELNIHYENGDQDPNNQYYYESEQFYQLIGWWVERTAQIIKYQAPEMRLIAPPFSPGRREDGAPDDQGRITEPFAGYDYLVNAVRTYFDNVLAVHAYWGDINGSYKDRLYDPVRSSWYAFRWRRLLKLFEARYNLQARVIIDEASNFAVYDLDLFEQITYFSRQCLADPRVLALTFYLWEDPTFSPGNIFNVWTQYILDLPGFTQRLAAQPDVVVGPARIFGGPTIRVSFDDGRIEAMPLEEYLRAVVPAEMPVSWPAEALKAQATAARTYALKAIQTARRQNKEADITSTYVRSQQFDRSRIHPTSDEAIRSTIGEAVVYDDDLVYAVFSANCGGHTFNNEDVAGFSKTPFPYLRGVSCPAPGPKYGHGVGMCQHGARVFAEQGWSYQQILAHYYQGTTLTRMSYA